MTPEERARFMVVVGAIDEGVAARPDILGSPVGFVMGALVSAANSDADAAWAQLAGLGDVLAYLSIYVREGRGEPGAIVDALVPAPAPTT